MQVCKDFIFICLFYLYVCLHVCFSTVSRHIFEQNKMCDIPLRDLRKQTRLHERFRQEIIVSKQYKEHSQNALSENIVLKFTEKQTLT